MTTLGRGIRGPHSEEARTRMSESMKAYLAHNPRVARSPQEFVCVVCGAKYFMQRAVTSRQRTCSRACSGKLGGKGERHHLWKGGTTVNAYGYVTKCVGGKKVGMHRLVMESMLGRPLLKGESVHHKNGVRHDNRPENLELWVTSQPPGQRLGEAQHCPTCTCGQPHG